MHESVTIAKGKEELMMGGRPSGVGEYKMKPLGV